MSRWSKTEKCSAVLTSGVIVSAAAVWLTLGRAWPGHAGAETVLPGDLLDSLRGGPIELRLAEHREMTTSREEAVLSAQRSTGLDDPPAQAWRVIVTDQEFMSVLVKDRPCWLVEFPNVLARQPGLLTPREDLFVLVDGETAGCWEAFTQPQAPWWDRVDIQGYEVLYRFDWWGQEAAPLPGTPEVSLFQALEQAKNPSFFSKAQQIIARRFAYTTLHEGTLEKDGTLTRRNRHQPVWYISLEGINVPYIGSIPAPLPGEKPAEMPNDEEVNYMVSATTGECISMDVYRSQKRTTAGKPSASTNP